MGVFSQGLNPNSGVTGAESADYLCDQSVVCSTTPTSLIKDRDLTGTLHSGTYLYSPYMAVPPPPPGEQHPNLSPFIQSSNSCVFLSGFMVLP